MLRALASVSHIKQSLGRLAASHLALSYTSAHLPSWQPHSVHLMQAQGACWPFRSPLLMPRGSVTVTSLSTSTKQLCPSPPPSSGRMLACSSRSPGAGAQPCDGLLPRCSAETSSAPMPLLVPALGCCWSGFPQPRLVRAQLCQPHGLSVQRGSGCRCREGSLSIPGAAQGTRWPLSLPRLVPLGCGTEKPGPLRQLCPWLCVRSDSSLCPVPPCPW